MNPDLVLEDLRKAFAERDIDAAATLFGRLDAWLTGGEIFPREWCSFERNATQALNLFVKA